MKLHTYKVWYKKLLYIKLISEKWKIQKIKKYEVGLTKKYYYKHYI